MALLINIQALTMSNSSASTSTAASSSGRNSSIRLTNCSLFSCEAKKVMPRILVIRNKLSSDSDSDSPMRNRSSKSRTSPKTQQEEASPSASSSDARNTATTTRKTKKQVVEDLERLFRLPSSPRHRRIDDDESDDGDSFIGGNSHGFSSYGRGYRRRPTIKVVYQGVRGSYCQEAAVKAFSSNISNVDLLSSCSTGMEDAFQALEDRSADRAIIPIENSLDGTIDRNLDLLLRHGQNVEILSELIIPVNHCLLAGNDQLINIRRIVSHPQALSHCKTKLLEYKSYLSSLGCDLEVIEVENAADAAKFISENGISDTAVIGSRVAAKEFGLQIVEENIQDTSNSGNFNRFLELGRKNINPCSTSSGIKNKKTTIAFALEKGVSDMHKALSIFERANINVTRVEHRPNRSNPVIVKKDNNRNQPPCCFDYVFILDLETEEERKLKVLLSELEKISGESVHVLGSNYTCRSIS
ncbi:hypothetical protein MKW98_013829 [Papaver atlanticum]|uniref:Prephenate dehydratase domain-containing protein n=1 Tax=Papaver atlanticum TaxID=357466 RepID=A0AAD4XSM5_9MAGN|nr:hypothetical protein MKW98_013829 [Papaver atlanticum]